MSGSTPFGRGAVKLFQDFNNSIENPKPYIFSGPSQDYSDAVARREVLQDKRAAANPFRSQSEEEYLKNLASYEDEKNNLNLGANPMVEKQNNNFLKQSYTPPTPVEVFDPENPFVVPRDKPAFPSDIIIPRDKPTPPTREEEKRGNIFQRLGTALSDENVRDRLIMGLQSLKADPNKAQIAMANERLKGRKTATQRNRTAEYIMQLTGDESMAKAVADGTLPLQSALSQAQNLEQRKSAAQFVRQQTGNESLAESVLGGFMSPKDAIESYKTSQEETRRANASRENVLASSGNVINAINKASDILANESWVSGFVGSRLADLKGSDANRLKAHIETVKGNIGFDRLQRMRDESPTGGALGQVAVQEMYALQNSLVSLDQALGAQELQDSLQQVYNSYKRIINKVGGTIPEALRTSGVPNQKNDEYSDLLEKYKIK